MNILEYQAREILVAAGIPMPPGGVARSGAEAGSVFSSLGVESAVVKAQVHAGGRGKAGGVKFARSAQEACEAANRMFAAPLVTHQTGPGGVPVKAVLVAGSVEIASEFYVGAVIDRRRGVPAMMVSSQGGVEIEEVARTNPSAIRTEPFHPLVGLQGYQARNLAASLGLRGRVATEAAALISGLARVFLANDCTLAEINPLAMTADGHTVAVDAKLNFDDSAAYRHPEWAKFADPGAENPAEARAKQAGLNYIALDGQIGCLVNGAGLAMSTMDIIKLHGGEPANFLDVGGGVTAQGAIEAFHILLSDPKVKAVLVNIFGGIAKCDLIAEALIQAGREVGFRIPVVVRLEGTNVEKARKLLANAASQLPTLTPATDLSDAAEKVVTAARQANP
ncbi:MAG: ADP-forming succinate--CoA ligase subunit beta [Phycisphaerae bacterium]|nr:ADP-forming succinate--CoA ligase subunit beta [Phycisphaerae bacterium]